MRFKIKFFCYLDYQPGWTLVGGGLKKAEDVCKDEKDFIPKGCDWIKAKAEGFDPINNLVFFNGDKKVILSYFITFNSFKLI